MLLIPFHLTCTNWNPHSSCFFLLLPPSLCHRSGRLWIWMEAAAEGRGIGHGPQHLPLTHTATNEPALHFVFVNTPSPLNVHFPLFGFICAHEFAVIWLFSIVCVFVSMEHWFSTVQIFSINLFPPILVFLHVHCRSESQIGSHKLGLWKTINNVV